MLTLLVGGSLEERKGLVQQYADKGHIILNKYRIMKELTRDNETHDKIFHRYVDVFEGVILSKLLEGRFKVVIDTPNIDLLRRGELTQVGRMFGVDVIAHEVNPDHKQDGYFAPIMEEGYKKIVKGLDYIG